MSSTTANYADKMKAEGWKPGDPFPWEQPNKATPPLAEAKGALAWEKRRFDYGKGVLCASPPEDELSIRRRLKQEEAALKKERTLSRLAENSQSALQPEIREEVAAFIDPQIAKDWDAFATFSEKYGFVSLPSPWQIIQAFLIESAPEDRERLYNSISIVHRGHLGDPTLTPDVRAVVRQARTATTAASRVPLGASPPQTPEGK